MAIPETIKKLANDIRTKIYGREVREALAQGIEEAGNIADQANQTSNAAVDQVRNIQAQVDQLVVEGDSSVEAAQARVDAKGNVFATLKERLDTKETQMETIKQRLISKINQPSGFNHRNSALFDTAFSRQPLVSFVSDDGDIEDYTVFKPLFDSYGWKFTLAIQTAYVGGRDKYDRQIMTWDQIHEMYAEGHTIAAHTHTHPDLTQLSVSDAEQEMVRSKEELLKRGFDVRHIMYPHGRANDNVYNLARKHYLSGAGIYPQINRHGCDNAKIGRFSVNKRDMTELKNAVDQAIDNNAWAVFYIHGYEAREPGFMNKLTELMDYIKNRNIKVVTYDDGYDYFIRRPVPLLPSRTFIMKSTQNIPNDQSSVEILLPNFNYVSDGFSDVIYRDTNNNRIVIKDVGRYLIEYSLLLRAETGCFVTVMLETNVQYYDGGYSPRLAKQQSFIIGDDSIVRPDGLGKKDIPVSGVAVVDFNPEIHKEAYVYLRVVFQKQSTTKTNQIVAWQDCSRLTVTKLA